MRGAMERPKLFPLFLVAVVVVVAAVAPIAAADEPQGRGVTIFPPEKEVPFGVMRVDVDVQPPVARIEFFLDGKRVVTRNRPPFTVELDLGKTLVRHEIKVDGYDVKGLLVDTDLRIVNAAAPSAKGRAEVVVPLVVLGTDGAPVEKIGQDEVEVVDGTLRPTIQVENADRLPLTLGIVLDLSAPMKDALPLLRGPLTQLLTSLVGERDRGFVVHYRDAAVLAIPPTAKVSALLNAVAETEAGGGSVLRDALILALYQFPAAPSAPGRRALVVLTEGGDTNSRAEMATVLDYARRTGVPVYVVGVNVSFLGIGPKSRLKELSAVTGGETVYVRGKKSLPELAPALARIEAELKAQAWLRFPAAPGDTFRPISVQVKRPGVKVRTAAGYFP